MVGTYTKGSLDRGLVSERLRPSWYFDDYKYVSWGNCLCALGKAQCASKFAHRSWARRRCGRQLRRDDIVVGIQHGPDRTRCPVGSSSYWHPYGGQFPKVFE